MKELDQILSGEGVNSESKIVKWATYATATVVIGGVCYAIYKSVKNGKEIEALQSQIQNMKGAQTVAPIDDVVSL